MVSDTCTAMMDDVLSMKYEMSTVSPGAHVAGGTLSTCQRSARVAWAKTRQPYGM